MQINTKFEPGDVVSIGTSPSEYTITYLRIEITQYQQLSYYTMIDKYGGQPIEDICECALTLVRKGENKTEG